MSAVSCEVTSHTILPALMPFIMLANIKVATIQRFAAGAAPTKPKNDVTKSMRLATKYVTIHAVDSNDLARSGSGDRHPVGTLALRLALYQLPQAIAHPVRSPGYSLRILLLWRHPRFAQFCRAPLVLPPYLDSIMDTHVAEARGLGIRPRMISKLESSHRLIEDCRLTLAVREKSV